MKRFKKLTALLVALAMMVALMPSAFAVTTTNVIIEDTSNQLKDHTFTAYQIFKGDVSSLTPYSDISWGVDIKDASNLLQKLTNVDGLSDALKDSSSQSLFKDCSSALDVALVITGFGQNSDAARAFAQIVSDCVQNGTGLTVGNNTLESGYYLIVDKTGSDTEGDSSPAIINESVLQVVGTQITIKQKVDVPSVIKKVKDDEYNHNEGYGTGFGDFADYDINENHTYRLIGSIPDMSGFASYTYQFHDTLSSGLTLNQSSVKVYLVSKDIDVLPDLFTTEDGIVSGIVDVTEQFNKDYSKIDSENSFSVGTDNLKGLVLSNGDSIKNYTRIVVEYTAHLNENAVVTLYDSSNTVGNPNTVSLEYSNNPNDGGEGTTTTPEDKVVVFTYELDFTKEDGNTKKPLSGAEFYLTNENGDYAVIENDVLTGWKSANDFNQLTELQKKAYMYIADECDHLRRRCDH